MPLDDDIFVSSYRQIVDLAGDDSSRFVIPMGQSGHIWSDRYANLLDTWNRAEYIPMRFTRLAVDDAAKATLVLRARDSGFGIGPSTGSGPPRATSRGGIRKEARGLTAACHAAAFRSARGLLQCAVSRETTGMSARPASAASVL